jgi:hypothetical protein
MTTRIRTDLVPDDPLVQDADYRFDDVDRAHMDDQIRACQEHLATTVLNGVVATWVRVDGASDALAQGDAVCVAATDAGFAAITKALPAALAAAGAVFGVALRAAPPGARALVGIAGVIAPSVAGVPPGPNRFVRCGPTARPERVAKFNPNDFPLGTATSAGFLALRPLPQIVP